MKFASSSLLLTAGVAAAAGAPSATATVSVFIPGSDPQPLVGSVVAADPTSTTLVVSCPTNVDDTECGLGGGVSIFLGPSTVTYALSSESYTLSESCTIFHSNNSALCTGSAIISGETSTLSDSVYDYSSNFLPITVTAGADKLSLSTGTAGPTTTTGTGFITSTTPTASPTTSSAAPPNTSHSSTSTSASNTAPAPTTSKSTGGAPRATQAAVVLGAMAMVGGAVLL